MRSIAYGMVKDVYGHDAIITCFVIDVYKDLYSSLFPSVRSHSSTEGSSTVSKIPVTSYSVPLRSSNAHCRFLCPLTYKFSLNWTQALLGHSAVTHAALPNWEYMDVISAC